MAPFDSFRELLTFYLLSIQPKKILEWGPGTSTGLMLKHSEAMIYTIEHDRRWYEKAKGQYGDDKHVQLFYKPEHIKYCNDPLYWGEFEMVFVDGFCDWRVDCLKTASKVVAEEGVVILHDSERTKYNEGVALFETIVESNGTKVMRKK